MADFTLAPHPTISKPEGPVLVRIIVNWDPLCTDLLLVQRACGVNRDSAARDRERCILGVARHAPACCDHSSVWHTEESPNEPRMPATHGDGVDRGSGLPMLHMHAARACLPSHVMLLRPACDTDTGVCA
jgi:hypothetical protein